MDKYPSATFCQFQCYKQWSYLSDPQVMYLYRSITYLSCGNMRSCSELYNSCSTFERNWPHHLSPPQSWTSRRPVCNRIFGVPLIHRCLNNSSQAWAWKVLCRTTGTECPFRKTEQATMFKETVAWKYRSKKSAGSFYNDYDLTDWHRGKEEGTHGEMVICTQPTNTRPFGQN